METAIGRQWLIFELAEQAYGIDVNHVREIVSLRNMSIHALPQTSACIEGVVVLRKRPIDVLDLRSLLGMNSLRRETEELAEILHEREADHCKWITELKACIEEHREFRLAIDPHKCKFGQWYDRLMADSKDLAKITNNDLSLLELFQQFDRPHQYIHSIAHRVLDAMAAGDIAAAKQIIDDTRNTDLRSLRRALFAKCREQIHASRSGLLFVLTAGDMTFGAKVDRVIEVVRFSDKDIRSVPGADLQRQYLSGVAEWGDAQNMVLLLDVPSIARNRCPAEAELACMA